MICKYASLGWNWNVESSAKKWCSFETTWENTWHCEITTSSWLDASLPLQKPWNRRSNQSFNSRVKPRVHSRFKSVKSQVQPAIWHCREIVGSTYDFTESTNIMFNLWIQVCHGECNDQASWCLANSSQNHDDKSDFTWSQATISESVILS